MSPAKLEDFSLTDPLPTGSLLLEASAGTGKTYTIAALATRYIAEQAVRCRGLLLLTFGRQAAAEMRAELFSRISTTSAALDEFLATGSLPAKAATDEVITCLISSGDIATKQQRLQTALTEFDQAEISTIHSFCEKTLAELGVLGDSDAISRLQANPSELVLEAAADSYLLQFGNHPPLELELDRALELASSVCNSQLPLASHEDEPRQYCEMVRQRFANRKRQLGIYTFDDLSSRLRALVSDSKLGEAVKAELRQRYQVVLVDEFQDTDPDQWAILEQVFLNRDAPTVLIGDPKQSIYGFRNADLPSYLKAAQETSDKRTLKVNYRSDKSVVEGVLNLFGELSLGDERITLPPVSANRGDELQLPAGDPAARVWIRHGLTAEDAPDQLIEADLVAQVRYLLAKAKLLVADPAAPDKKIMRPVLASDIAVLTHTRYRGADLVKALQQAGVPAVLSGSGTVFSSPAATAWQLLLAALVNPTRTAVMQAAMSDLIGSSFQDLLHSDAQAFAAALSLLQQLTASFSSGGCTELTNTLLVETDLATRLLGQAEGERRFTDLLHVAELLAQAPATDLAGLHDWLSQQIAADELDDTGQSALRAATDQLAVRVATMHSTKGLGFPIVLLPQLSRQLAKTTAAFPLINETGERELYVGSSPRPDTLVGRAAARQARQEELRLLYVALTRAKHLVIAWHVAKPGKTGFLKQVARGALTAVLGREREAMPVAGSSTVTHPELGCGSEAISPLPPAKLADEYFQLPNDLAANFDPTKVHISAISQPVPPVELPAPATSSELPTARQFTRKIDTNWRRTSYSGLTAGLHQVASHDLADEPAELELLPTQLTEAVNSPSPWAELPGGRSFGSLVHTAFEELDWDSAQLTQNATAVASKLAPDFGLDPAQTEQLTRALIATCTTPLGDLADGASLSQLPISSRLAELDFDLPLADHGAPATVQQLAELMAAHLAANDPLLEYPARLAASGAAPAVLKGFLTGSIDLVLQLPSQGFIVADYKTNRLPTLPGETLAAGHYLPAAMAEAMMQAHYPLQALLYCAALHRYLAWRQPNYRPELHLAGVGYLFVRGMVGPNTPQLNGNPCGVFQWYPPVELILASSRLLGGNR